MSNNVIIQAGAEDVVDDQPEAKVVVGGQPEAEVAAGGQPEVELSLVERKFAAIHNWTSYTPTFKNRVILAISSLGVTALAIGFLSIFTFSVSITTLFLGIGLTSFMVTNAIAIALKCLW